MVASCLVVICLGIAVATEGEVHWFTICVGFIQDSVINIHAAVLQLSQRGQHEYAYFCSKSSGPLGSASAQLSSFLSSISKF